MPLYTGKIRRITGGDDYLVTTETGSGGDETSADLATQQVATNLGAALSAIGTAITALPGTVRTIHISVVTTP